MTKNRALHNHTKTAILTYLDTTAKVLFTLPKGAVLLAMYAKIKTAFNDTGTDLLDIGDAADNARLVNDQSLATAATSLVALTVLLAGRLSDTLTITGEYEVVGKYIGANSDASAGVVEIFAVYADTFSG